MEKLREFCRRIGIELDDKAIASFQKYMQLVLEWNERINLTSITNEEEFIVKHFFDSLTLLKTLDIKESAKIIDVGTGAGFPGIPIKIVRPDIELTLLDSLNKRLVFLNDVVLPEIEAKANIIHGRAEEISKLNSHREMYNYSVSRAVANLSALSEYCLPFVKVGGVFCSMKGPDCIEEVNQAKNAINTLGGKVAVIENLTLPDNSGRSIVVIDKVRNTPLKYPRRGVKISKNPL